VGATIKHSCREEEGDYVSRRRTNETTGPGEKSSRKAVARGEEEEEKEGVKCVFKI